MTFLGMVPNHEEMAWMRDRAFTSLVGRTLQPRLDFMSGMKHCVEWEIKHEYSEEMAKASTECSLALWRLYQMKETPEIATRSQAFVPGITVLETAQQPNSDPAASDPDNEPDKKAKVPSHYFYHRQKHHFYLYQYHFHQKMCGFDAYFVLMCLGDGCR